MALSDFTPLASALAASVVLHAGAYAALEYARGSAPTSGRPYAATHPARLHVSLPGTTTGTTPASPSPSHPAEGIGHMAAAGTAVRGIIDLPVQHYFPVGELDAKPEARGSVPLDYPQDVPLMPLSRVVLSLLIDELGKVNKVVVESADSPKELEDLASRAFMGARFSPGMRSGTAVKSRLRVEVTFEGE